MSSSRAVLVVGESGEGKSTLINLVVGAGAEPTVVSHSKSKDGTLDVQAVASSKSRPELWIDTPGMNSSEANASITEQVQMKFMDKEILLLLVLNKRRGRVTPCFKKFIELQKNFFKPSTPFLMVWVGDGSLPESDHDDVAEIFPEAIQLDITDHDIQELEETVKRPDLFKIISKREAEIKLEIKSEIKSGKAKQVAAKKKSKQVIPQPVAVSKQFIGFSKAFSRKNFFKQSDPPPSFENMVRRLLVVKSEGGDEFRVLKMMGDTTLRLVTYEQIYRMGYIAEMEGIANLIIGNSQGSAMSRFFDSHLTKLHDKAIPAERGKIKDHAKCDVVEALIEYTRLNNHVLGIQFIFSQLFIYSGRNLN